MRLLRILKDKRGSDSVEFLANAGMLLFIFVALMCIVSYVMRYYDASYACRRIVRSTEVTGMYDVSGNQTYINGLSGHGMENVAVNMNAVYFEANKIQLKSTFTVTLTGDYKVVLLSFGDSDISFSVPVKVSLKGMSEVYWRTT